MEDGLGAVRGGESFKPGIAGHCPACAAVPDHPPVGRLGPDAGGEQALPPLLAVTADGNTKCNRFASAGAAHAREGTFMEFFSHTRKEVTSQLAAYKVG